MTIDVNVVDGFGKDSKVCVLKTGQIVTGPYNYSTASTQELATDDVSVNFWGPKPCKRFVITDIILTGDKSIATGTDATVQIYESSDGPATGTVTTAIITLKVARSATVALTGLNLITAAGTWINAETNDDNVFATIMGYYIPEEIR